MALLVALTGATGFIGGTLARRLLAAGCEVRALVRARSRGKPLPWMALRPPAVYGPGDREMLPLFQLMRHGVVPLWGARGDRFSLLYVVDLADAVIHWIRRGAPYTCTRQRVYADADALEIARTEAFGLGM